MAADSPLSVRLKPDVKAALVALAAELDRPVSWVVQRLIEQGLGEGALLPPVDVSPAVVAPVRVVSPERGLAMVECPDCEWVSPVRSARCPTHDRRRLIPK